MIRIVFLGTPNFAVPFLRALADDEAFEIVAVVSQPDKPSGRGNEIKPTPTKVFALERGIPVFQPEKIKTPETLELFRAFNADLFVVVAYGRIIPKTILDLPRLGCVNVHPSLLPRHRGPAPMQAVIAQGDEETGVSIMLLDEGMDTGPILATQTFLVAPDETYRTLETKVHEVGTSLLVSTLKQWTTGSVKPIPQSNAGATVTKLLDREDGHANWTLPAPHLDRLRRAYEPWPGLWTLWKRPTGEVRLKILIARPSDRTLVPGHVVREEDRLFIGCGKGSLELLRIQAEGAAVMDAKTFLRAYKDFETAELI